MSKKNKILKVFESEVIQTLKTFGEILEWRPVGFLKDVKKLVKGEFENDDAFGLNMAMVIKNSDNCLIYVGHCPNCGSNWLYNTKKNRGPVWIGCRRCGIAFLMNDLPVVMITVKIKNNEKKEEK